MIRPQSLLDGHDSGPHIRYVQEYATDDTERTITGATVANPIVITSAGHGFATGDHVIVEGVAGNTNANGCWNITVLTADTFELDDSEGGPSSYTSGGTATYAQPVQAKLLKWDADTCEFVAYGTEFRVGDADTPDQVGSGGKFWVAWRGDANQWHMISGGGGEAIDRSIGKTTSTILAASGDPRVPTTGGGTIVKGTAPTSGWENWTLKEIPTGTHVVLLEIDGDPVIVAAFC